MLNKSWRWCAFLMVTQAGAVSAQREPSTVVDQASGAQAPGAQVSVDPNPPTSPTSGTDSTGAEDAHDGLPPQVDLSGPAGAGTGAGPIPVPAPLVAPGPESTVMPAGLLHAPTPLRAPRPLAPRAQERMAVQQAPPRTASPQPSAQARAGASVERAPAGPGSRFVPGRFSAGLFASALGRADDGLARFGNAAVSPGGGALVSYDLYATSSVRLGVEGSWALSGGKNRALRSGQFESKYTSHRILGGMAVIGCLLPRLWPHLRVSGGAVGMWAEVKDSAGAFVADARGWSPLLEAALGASALIPVGLSGEGHGRAMFVRAEVGYAVAGSTGLEVESAPNGAILADLGRLHPGGLFGRVAIGVRL